MLPETFHPIIRKWFTETYGNPVSVQAESWPLIERGENVLAIAPTGSGKTLTAFLSAISGFCPGTQRQYRAEQLSVLYISPLKALNEDIKRNLLEPLAAIKLRFEKEGLEFPPVRVETRSGDTPQSQRRRFFIKPPSILALTPESLSILLLNPKGRKILSAVKYLIIDEIHALIGNKRGAFLSCQIDRLSSVAGEFQRISLSATVCNPQTAAEFVGGIGRQVHIVAPAAEKQIDFSVEYQDKNLRYAKQRLEDSTGVPDTENKPKKAGEAFLPKDYGSSYTAIIDYVLGRIGEGSTLLVFTESRRRAERLCYFINQTAADTLEYTAPAACPHHGSLSKELRRSVEKGLAEGKIPCVVATASLELGIDIGSVDEVVLAGSPSNVSQVLQRIGRSGHGVGQVSRGRLFAFHGKDLLLAAALKDAVDERDIEEIHPIENPLDILAQIVLSLCCEKDRNIDELYEYIKNFYIFRNLNYNSFNRVVYMLAGMSADMKTRQRDIKPRLWLDKTEMRIGALDGTVTLLYTSGGVIANRGLYSLRLADKTKIGELDEEFVWERRIGDCFDFGARGWRITNITSESVEVVPLENITESIPFWKSDVFFRSVKLTKKIMAVLENYNKTFEVKTNLSAQAQSSLKSFLDSQLAAQNKLPLPDINNITVEIISENELNRDFCTIVFHSFRGGQVNYPLSLALSAQMEEITGLRIESFANDDNILFLLPRPGIDELSVKPQEFFCRALAALEKADTSGINRGERLFRNRLESSGLFGAAFREAAERSLLLPKSPFGKRTPLWIMRQRSKRLFDAVADEDGFPVTAEAWRSCLVDTFDMEGFRALITALNDGSITLSFFYNKNPSPFSEDIVRQETNTFMYEYDERRDLAGKTHRAGLSDKVIEEAIGSSVLRPVLKLSIINDFTSKLRRELQGWAPQDSLSMNEWVKERIAIPLDEWKILCAAAMMPENAVDTGKIKTVMRNGASIASIVHREWENDWKNEPLNLLGQWLRFEGPVSIERICEIFGVTAGEAQDAVNALVEVDEVIGDIKTEASSQLYVCDRENLEMLLRISRKKQRAAIKERPVSVLIPFLAVRQGLTGNAVLGKNLHGWSAPAKLWETEIFCARDKAYDSEKTDREIKEGRLVWYGTGKEKISFCHPEDLDLVFDLQKSGAESKLSPLLLSSFFNRPRDFWEIKNETGMDSRSCSQTLWNEVWQGSLTADSFDPVRKGIETGFIPKEIENPVNTESIRPFGRQPRVPAALRNRWRYGAPVGGNWFSLLMEEGVNDSLEEDAINRDRIRLLLERWGVLCRPLLEREQMQFSWSKLLPAMRRMELSGELVTGRFFSGINSLQFASTSIAAELEQAQEFDGIYWMNAADPASPAGLEIEGLEYALCARSSGSRLYYKGAKLIAVSVKNGREIQIFTEAGSPDTDQLINLFKIQRTRKILPINKITIEKINGQTAAGSVYASFFQNHGFVSDRGKLIYW